MQDDINMENTLNLESGWICLDFANTAEWHASDHPKESINSYNDLVTWATEIKLLTEKEGKDLLTEASRNPNKATSVFKHAISLREAIYHIFSAISADHQLKPQDLKVLNDSLSKSLGHLQLSKVNSHFMWNWLADKNSLDKMLWPVSRSASRLLTSENLNRTGECADEHGCGWLFFDTSRNRSRRWCDMKDCGNRDKVRRYYKKAKKS